MRSQRKKKFCSRRREFAQSPKPFFFHLGLTPRRERASLKEKKAHGAAIHSQNGRLGRQMCVCVCLFVHLPFFSPPQPTTHHSPFSFSPLVVMVRHKQQATISPYFPANRDELRGSTSSTTTGTPLASAIPTYLCYTTVDRMHVPSPNEEHQDALSRLNNSRMGDQMVAIHRLAAEETGSADSHLTSSLPHRVISSSTDNLDSGHVDILLGELPPLVHDEFGEEYLCFSPAIDSDESADAAQSLLDDSAALSNVTSPTSATAVAMPESASVYNDNAEENSATVATPTGVKCKQKRTADGRFTTADGSFTASVKKRGRPPGSKNRSREEIEIAQIERPYVPIPTRRTNATTSDAAKLDSWRSTFVSVCHRISCGASYIGIFKHLASACRDRRTSMLIKIYVYWLKKEVERDGPFHMGLTSEEIYTSRVDHPVINAIMRFLGTVEASNLR